MEMTLPADSLFGYSIAYQKSMRHLIISAPTADNIGQIFRAELDNGFVRQIPVPISHDQSNQDNYWLGASVQTNSTNFITCAPRSTDYFNTRVSKCIFESQNRMYFITLQPSDKNLGLDGYGWSIYMDEDIYLNNPILKGNVQVFSIEENSFFEKKYSLYDIQQKALNFGYSIVNGKFFSNEFSSLAISSTYGEYGQGKIFFFEGTLEVGSISDGEVGSMFGAVLAVANLGGPRSCLLVGAPTHTTTARSYDVGAVYLYTPEYDTKILKLHRIITGVSNAGYFGAAIASVGDMDDDGLDEVAISAPYENDGQGAVYIYTGAGLLAGHSWAQRIEPPDTMYTFGLSLSALDDFTLNGCDGLAIGAPRSNKVALYRGIPLITVVLSTNYTLAKRPKDANSFDIEVKLNVNYSSNLGRIDAVLAVKLEIMHPNAKLADAGADGTYTYNVALASKDTEMSRRIKILTPAEGDYEQVISYKVSAELVNDPMSAKHYRTSQVMLSDRSILLSLGSIWAADCGSMECNPKFTAKLTSSMPKTYTPWTSDNETVSIYLHNDGETAYSACVKIRVHTARILQPSSSCVRMDDDVLICKPKTLLRNGDYWNITNIYLETSDLTSNEKTIQIDYDVYNHCNKDEKTHYEEIFVLESVSTGIIVQRASNVEGAVNITTLEIEEGKRLQHSYTISNLGPTNWVSVKCEVVLPRRKYLEVMENPIEINTEKSVIKCDVNANEGTEDVIKALCNIGDLRRTKATKIFISMFVLPKGLENIIYKENVELTTEITLMFNEQQTYSITNTLCYYRETVSSWIILLAILFGLLIIIIIGYVLYRCGFLQRKKKQRLNNLKKSIRKQNSDRQKDRTSGAESLQCDEEYLVPDEDSVQHHTDK
ncbi:integrin alpha-5-like [Colias croceus]|uniref:integrin alpha-5-like n=1 Tax=Colias crocea TaxID=72248 RepID=UPI001E280519|nr:integrin alpha-5-like [Colias croceus]